MAQGSSNKKPKTDDVKSMDTNDASKCFASNDTKSFAFLLEHMKESLVILTPQDAHQQGRFL